MADALQDGKGARLNACKRFGKTSMSPADPQADDIHDVRAGRAGDEKIARLREKMQRCASMKRTALNYS